MLHIGVGEQGLGFLDPLQHLRDGGELGILFDQHAGDLGTWCPLFGRLARRAVPLQLSVRERVALAAVVLDLAVYAPGITRNPAAPPKAGTAPSIGGGDSFRRFQRTRLCPGWAGKAAKNILN